MNRRQLIVATLIIATGMLTTTPVQAAREAHTFVATANGLTTEVSLQFDGDNRFVGTMKENRGQVSLKGQVQGRRLSGHLHDPASGQPLLPFSAELDGDTLLLTLQMPQASSPATFVLHRQGTRPGAAPAARAPAGAAIDPRLAGRWHLQTSINSGGGAGGFASFTTVRTLVLSPDGQLQQWVRSVGGGGSWSHRSGDELEIAARWTSQGGAIWVLPEGHAAYVHAGNYRVEDNVLVIGEGQARQIWRR